MSDRGAELKPPSDPGGPLVSHRFVEPAPVAALVSLFDDGLGPLRRGDPLPPLWHWAALAEWAPTSLAGQDGHPRTGGLLPDLGKPRRMFAGGQVDFHAPLSIGEAVRQEDRVVSVTNKAGRQGEFVLVRVETRVFRDDEALALVEHRDLVYRDAHDASGEEPGIAAPTASVGRPLDRSADDSWTFRTDPTLLFRFSSATSNGHRIHYDLVHARSEGYPRLIVHGPFMTLAMLEVLRLLGLDVVRGVSHRNVRPLFCGDAAHIVVDRAAGGATSTVTLTSSAGAHAVLTVEAAMPG